MALQGDLLRARKKFRDKPVEGVRICADILRRFPSNRPARDMLRGLDRGAMGSIVTEVQALMERGAWKATLDLAVPIGRARPTDATLAAFEATALARLGRGEAALARALPLLESQPDHPGLLAAAAMGYAASGHEDRAAELLDRAATLRPNDGHLLNQYAGSLRTLGRLDEAREIVARTLILPSPPPKTWLFAAELMGFADRPDLLAALNAAARQPGLSLPAQADLCFAGAQAAFDLDNPESAFAHLEHANAIVAHLRPYDAAGGQRLIDRLIDRIAPHAELTGRASERVEIVLIVGMPRSGTTLVERILDAHPQIEGLGELYALGDVAAELPAGDAPVTSDDLKHVAEGYRARIAQHRRTGARVIVDKMPSNAFRAGLALAALPEARVLDIRRDPVAVAFSNWRHHFFSGNAFAYGIDRIAAQTRLTRHAMDAWQTAFPGRVRTVAYEHLVDDPAGEIGGLLDWLGLPPSAACTEFRGARGGAVATSSAQQVRQGIYKGSSKSWHRYRDWMAPLIAAHAGASAEHEALLDAPKHSDPSASVA